MARKYKLVDAEQVPICRYCENEYPVCSKCGCDLDNGFYCNGLGEHLCSDCKLKPRKKK